MQKCPRHADALPLAAGKGAAQLTHGGVVALGQAADKVIQRSLFAGGFHLCLRSIALCNADVVADGIRKQFGLLRHKTFLRAQGGGVHPPDVRIPKPDVAGLHVPEAHQQPQQGAFAAAGAPGDAHDLFFRDGQADLPQHLLPRVAKADIAHLGPRKGGVFAVGHLGGHRCFVQQCQHTVCAGKYLRQPCAKVRQRHHRPKGAKGGQGAHQHPLRRQRAAPVQPQAHAQHRQCGE